MEENLKAVFILEILGKPAEHVKKILGDIVERLGKEKNVKIFNKNIAEPKAVEKEEGFFTSFAEIEFETNLHTLMLLIYGYMPSHVEVTEPEELKIKNSYLTSFFSELTMKLHQYDEIAKTILLERQTIMKQVQEGKIKIPVMKAGKTEKAGKAEKRGKRGRKSM